MVVVNNSSELSSQLSSATGGEIIELAEGVTFGTIDVNSKQYASTVTIKSQNPANKNTVGRCRARNGTTHIKFQDLISVYNGQGGFAQYQFFYIQSSSNVTIENCEIYTDLTTSPSNSETGFLIGIASGTDILIKGCNIYNYFFGIYCLDGRTVTVEDTWIHDGRSDRIHFARTDDMTIQDCFLGANNVTRGDHADMVQCGRGPASNRRRSDRIIIRNNVFDQGLGGWSQTVHMGDDGAFGATYTHDGVTIENNIIYGGHQNAMNISNIDNAFIRNNTVISTPSGVSYEPTPGNRSEPRFNIINSDSYTGTISDNISSSFVIPSGGNWTTSNNIVSTLADFATHYDIIAEAPIPDSYNDLEIKSGTALHTSAAGSPMMKRSGGWPQGGITPNSNYAGGFSSAGTGTAPTVNTLTPADDATGIAVAVQPVAVFDKSIMFGSGNIVLRENDGGWSDLETFDVASDVGSAAGQVEISNGTLTIHPTSPLVAGRQYAIRIAATAIDDTETTPNSFAGIADDTTWSFTALSSVPSLPTNGQITFAITVG